MKSPVMINVEPQNITIEVWRLESDFQKALDIYPHLKSCSVFKKAFVNANSDTLKLKTGIGFDYFNASI